MRRITLNPITESRKLTQLPHKRVISRLNIRERLLYEKTLRRITTRLSVNNRNYFFTGRAVLSRLDFQGYQNDSEILKRFAHKWAQEEYAAILLQIIQRGSQDERNF